MRAAILATALGLAACGARTEPLAPRNPTAPDHRTAVPPSNGTTCAALMPPAMGTPVFLTFTTGQVSYCFPAIAVDELGNAVFASGDSEQVSYKFFVPSADP